MTPLHCIVYVSSAARELSQQDLDNILQQARVLNRAAGLTGVLLHCNGNFMQLLEGPSEQIQDTFQRIKRSALHHQIIELLSEPLEARQFSDWDMAFTQAKAAEFFALRNASWRVRASADGETEESSGMELLMQFWKSTR